jgi:hypothetical protein
LRTAAIRACAGCYGGWSIPPLLFVGTKLNWRLWGLLEGWRAACKKFSLLLHDIHQGVVGQHHMAITHRTGRRCGKAAEAKQARVVRNGGRLPTPPQKDLLSLDI